MRPRVWTLLCLAALAQPSSGGESVALRDSEQKIVYALGLSLAERLVDFELSADELALVQAGLRDGVAGTPAISLETWGPRVEKLLSRRRETAAARQRAESRAYLDAAAREAGAIHRGSGLIYRELRAGKGAAPSADSRVKVHYHGTRIDGSVFDSSVQRGKPARFSLGSVIACWKEGVQLMQPGGKARLVCPPEIAYGQKGMPGKIKPGETLTFEIELLEVLPAQPAAPGR
jgi:FKBP-type peptidyl-prolyl cis-trans isomerase